MWLENDRNKLFAHAKEKQKIYYYNVQMLFEVIKERDRAVKEISFFMYFCWWSQNDDCLGWGYIYFFIDDEKVERKVSILLTSNDLKERRKENKV